MIINKGYYMKLMNFLKFALFPLIIGSSLQAINPVEIAKNIFKKPMNKTALDLKQCSPADIQTAFFILIIFGGLAYVSHTMDGLYNPGL
jgi:hypothetical protein